MLMALYCLNKLNGGVMKKTELAMLEKAYSAETDAALERSVCHLMQTKSKVADKLVEEGLLRRAEIKISGPLACTIQGYELTDAGRLTYCLSCS